MKALVANRMTAPCTPSYPASVAVDAAHSENAYCVTAGQLPVVCRHHQERARPTCVAMTWRVRTLLLTRMRCLIRQMTIPKMGRKKRPAGAWDACEIVINSATFMIVPSECHTCHAPSYCVCRAPEHDPPSRVPKYVLSSMVHPVVLAAVIHQLS